jgi:hypothetical protein
MEAAGDVGQRQRTAEALVHMSYGRAYGRALSAQASMATPENRKAAAATIMAERAATAERDPAALNLRDAQAGRSAMEQAYGQRANDVSAVLSGRVAAYDLPRGFGGTKDMSALVSKAQLLVNQTTVESFASRGRVEAIGHGGNYLALVEGKAAESREKLTAHMLHAKSAIESAVDRKTIDREQGDNLYQRFQNAAFAVDEKKAVSADYAAFEKATTPRLRQEVSREVDARYAAQAATIDRARSNELDPASVARADAFRRMAPEDAMKKHPELAGAYGALAAVSKQAEASGMNPQQQAVIMAKAQQNIAAGIERGQVPEVKVRESREVRRDAVAER